MKANISFGPNQIKGTFNSVAPTGGRDNLLSRLRSSKSLLAEVHIWLKRSDARARHLLSLRDPDNKLSGPP
jgi:hypothetical protein